GIPSREATLDGSFAGREPRDTPEHHRERAWRRETGQARRREGDCRQHAPTPHHDRNGETRQVGGHARLQSSTSAATLRKSARRNGRRRQRCIVRPPAEGTRGFHEGPRYPSAKAARSCRRDDRIAIAVSALDSRRNAQLVFAVAASTASPRRSTIVSTERSSTMKGGASST